MATSSARFRSILPSLTRVRRALEPYIIHALAALSLACILWLSALVLPVEWMGFRYDALQERVTWVEPGSEAARAGVQVGDRFHSIYGVPITVTEHIPYMRELIDQHPFVLIEAERGGQELLLTVQRRAPTWTDQSDILVFVALALPCWLVGYILGVARRVENQPHPAVALFWMLLSCWLGAMPFAGSLSFPLYAALHVILLTIIIPLGIYVHIEFPRRPWPTAWERRAKAVLCGTITALTAGALTIIWVINPRPLFIVSALSDVLLLGVLMLFLASGLMLWTAHRRTTIAHVQRQIRIIGFACFSTTVGWLLLNVLPALISLSDASPMSYANLVALPIPLAYLVVGLSNDLYRLDRLIRIVLSHMLALFTLVLGVIGVSFVLDEQRPGQLLWIILVGVLLYRPVQLFCYRRIGLDRLGAQRYQTLNTAVARAATTLDERDIWEACDQGLAETFDDPPRALYRYIPDDAHFLLWSTYRLLHLPPEVQVQQLEAALRERPNVRFSRDLAEAVQRSQLAQDEMGLLDYQGIVLWCPLLNAHQQLLGVVVLGQQPNHDAYRPEDLTALQSFVNALGLAFANSYALQASEEQGATISALLQHVQGVQDATSAEISHRLHDKVVNGQIWSNLLAIDDLLEALPPEFEGIRKGLKSLRVAEEDIAQTLRVICEDLHPSSIDEPVGLPIALEAEIRRLRSLGRAWKGVLSFETVSEPLPLSPKQQLTGLRICREAVTNALKHAQATKIHVRLIYPATDQGEVTIEVRDDGIGATRSNVRAGHFGIRNMREAATGIGGTFQINSRDGTTVVIRFPCIAPPSPGA